MTDLLRIAHPQNCPPYGNSRVGICEIHHIIAWVNSTRTIYSAECVSQLETVVLLEGRSVSDPQLFASSHLLPAHVRRGIYPTNLTGQSKAI